MEKPSAMGSRPSADATDQERFEDEPRKPWPFKGHTPSGQQSRKSEAYERRIKRHWYPPLLVSMALNLFLLVAVFYMIYKAEHYKRSRRGFLTTVFLIIFIPLFPIGVLLLWPWDSAWKKQRDIFSERKSSSRWIYVINILGGLACFFFVSCYLIFSAIPKHNAAVWETVVDFPRDVPVPAVALITLNGGSPRPEVFFQEPPNGSSLGAALIAVDGETMLNDTDIIVHQDSNLTVTAQVANFSILSSTLDTPLQKILLLRARIYYNGSRVNDDIRDMQPMIYLAAFDPRLTVEEAMNCNLAQLALPSAFAANTFLLTLKQIHDPESKIVPPADSAALGCERVYNELLPRANPPLSMFDLSLMSSTPTNSNPSEDCADENVDDASCVSIASLTYGTQFITTQKSVPGKSRQDMWIDCGAIVGAVQFFQWLFIVFFQP